MSGETPISTTSATLIQCAVARGKKSPFPLSFGCGLVVLGVLCNRVLAGQTTMLSWDIAVTGCALILVLTGLLLILHVLWSRLSNWGLFALAVVLVLVYSLVYAFTLGLLFIGSRGDYGHCREMIQSVAATAPIPASAFNPTEPAVFCLEGNYGLFRTRYQILQVYGVTGRAKQDAILVKLKQVRHIENTEAIQVLFYQRENVVFWRNDKNGASGGTRGPESLLRIAVVR
jgi:hypothetical protein